MILDTFVYKSIKKECVGKSTEWVREAINVVMRELDAQIDKDGKAPEGEQLDRIESVLHALKEELEARMSKK